MLTLFLVGLIFSALLYKSFFDWPQFSIAIKKGWSKDHPFFVYKRTSEISFSLCPLWFKKYLSLLVFLSHEKNIFNA